MRKAEVTKQRGQLSQCGQKQPHEPWGISEMKPSLAPPIARLGPRSIRWSSFWNHIQEARYL
ncbi:MAG: hypothetical protein OEY37_04725, partial [Gammaproteobacteria bacterium]|nr:hypothetical protein [Gammaproteobacteria bacterium]